MDGKWTEIMDSKQYIFILLKSVIFASLIAYLKNLHHINLVTRCLHKI